MHLDLPAITVGGGGIAHFSHSGHVATNGLVLEADFTESFDHCLLRRNWFFLVDIILNVDNELLIVQINVHLSVGHSLLGRSISRTATSTSCVTKMVTSSSRLEEFSTFSSRIARMSVVLPHC